MYTSPHQKSFGDSKVNPCPPKDDASTHHKEASVGLHLPGLPTSPLQLLGVVSKGVLVVPLQQPPGYRASTATRVPKTKTNTLNFLLGILVPSQKIPRASSQIQILFSLGDLSWSPHRKFIPRFKAIQTNPNPSPSIHPSTRPSVRPSDRPSICFSRPKRQAGRRQLRDVSGLRGAPVDGAGRAAPGPGREAQGSAPGPSRRTEKSRSRNRDDDHFFGRG